MDCVGKNVMFVLDRNIFGKKTNKRAVIAKGHVEGRMESEKYKVRIEKPEDAKKYLKYIKIKESSILRII